MMCLVQVDHHHLNSNNPIVHLFLAGNDHFLFFFFLQEPLLYNDVWSLVMTKLASRCAGQIGWAVVTLVR